MDDISLFDSYETSCKKVRYTTEDSTTEDSSEDSTTEDSYDDIIPYTDLRNVRTRKVAPEEIVGIVGPAEALRAQFWRDWKPEDDWRDGEYIPRTRHSETGKVFDSLGYMAALNEYYRGKIVPVDNGVSPQVAMAVWRDLEDEMERDYQATNPNQIEEIAETEKPGETGETEEEEKEEKECKEDAKDHPGTERIQGD